MKIDISAQSLIVYEALASQVRLNIIQLLSRQPMNIKELARTLNLSSAIMTMHINKLEKAGIIRTELHRSRGGTQKISSLITESIEIEFPFRKGTQRNYYESLVTIGHYTDFSITPTCGLATTGKIIGHFDDPRSFLDPERVHAGILWFQQGFIEYKIPNYLLSSDVPIELEISMELGSEAPGVNDQWPSDISFFFNEKLLGSWTSPGDFGGKRGKFTPEWWSLGVGQFGLLKVLRINNSGTYIDGERFSEVTIEDLDIHRKQCSFRVGVPEEAVHPGGVTLFGSGFGNYNQDLIFRLYYRERDS